MHHGTGHGFATSTYHLNFHYIINHLSLSLSTTVSSWPLLNHDSYELDFALLTYGLDFALSMGFRLSVNLVLHYLDLNLSATANVYNSSVQRQTRVTSSFHLCRIQMLNSVPMFAMAQTIQHSGHNLGSNNSVIWVPYS